MASVRKRTWMTQRGEAKAAWIVDHADNRGDRQRKHFSTKKAADAFRIRIEGQMQAGTYRPDADKVTVKKACENFIERCIGRNQRDERMTRKMLVVYKGHVTNYILDPNLGLGGRKLSQLTARSVGEFRDRLRNNAGVTVPTARKILATLHSALEYAISQDWVATNAARGIKVIGPRSEGSERITPPSKAIMRALLDAADEDVRLMVQFAAATGARAGEQWAVRWRDLDLDNGRLNISRRVDAYRDEGAPKSVAGVRTVPISGHLAANLKAWKLRSTCKKPDDLVFPSKRGKHMGHDNFIKRKFLPVVAKLNDTGFNWHALRHFAVSCWIEAGLTPKTVQTFAGHASLQVTMDRYGHLFPSDDHHRAMNQIAKDLFA
jgi:integrase